MSKIIKYFTLKTAIIKYIYIYIILFFKGVWKKKIFFSCYDTQLKNYILLHITAYYSKSIFFSLKKKKK